VSRLYRKHDIDCCRRGFNRRADGVCGEESFLEPTENIKQTKLEEENENRNNGSDNRVKRNESIQDRDSTMPWVRRHDEYEA
jgi:hypothetical protein